MIMQTFTRILTGGQYAITPGTRSIAILLIRRRGGDQNFKKELR